MAIVTDEDEGKFLVDATGEQIGIVTGVEENVAYVEPDPGVSEAVLQGFGFGSTDEDDIEVPGDSVETVTDKQVRVSGTLE